MIFNTNDSFFDNEICFKFYDIHKSDIILAHHMEFIFQKFLFIKKFVIKMN